MDRKKKREEQCMMEMDHQNNNNNSADDQSEGVYTMWQGECGSSSAKKAAVCTEQNSAVPFNSMHWPFMNTNNLFPHQHSSIPTQATTTTSPNHHHHQQMPPAAAQPQPQPHGGHQQPSSVNLAYNSISRGFAFPPQPYPGQWDPLMWWMQHAHQQAFYPFMLPGCAGAVPYATSAPVSSPGVNQRGFIKPPAGLPHQHCQMWEMQSTENMQLWAMVAQLSTAVTRSDAEITFQRGKIAKLENDLQQALRVLNRGVDDHDPLDAIKTNATIIQPHTKITMNTTTIPHTKIRRERIKRGGSTGPVAIVCLPAMSQPSLVTKGRPRKAARGSLGQVEEGSQLKTLVSDNASRHSKAYNSSIMSLYTSSSDLREDQQQNCSPSPETDINGALCCDDRVLPEDRHGKCSLVLLANGNERAECDKMVVEGVLNVNSQQYSPQVMKDQSGMVAAATKKLSTLLNDDDTNRTSDKMGVNDERNRASDQMVVMKEEWIDDDDDDRQEHKSTHITTSLLGGIGLLNTQHGFGRENNGAMVSTTKMALDWHLGTGETGSNEDVVNSGQDDNDVTIVDHEKANTYFSLSSSPLIPEKTRVANAWRL